MNLNSLADLAKGLLIAFCVIAILAGLFEIYLVQRAADERTRLEERFADRDRCSRAAQDPRLIYEIIPGRCGANSQGFRDAEREFAKPPDVYRIILLGDSVAQGHGVARRDRFGELLARRFGDGVEIINLARTGYSTSQELVVLDQWGWRYQPDLILWSYVLNDPAHPVYHDANGELGRYYFRPAWQGYAYFARKLFEAREQWLSRDCETTYHELLHCVYRADIARDIAALGRAGQARGVPILFAILPLLVDDDPYPHLAIHADLTTMAMAAGLRVVDLASILRETDPERLRQNRTTWIDPWHPNETGHRRIADQLYDEVAALRKPASL